MFRAIDKWLLPVLRHGLPGKSKDSPCHIMFCMADHFEPFQGTSDSSKAIDQVEEWVSSFPDALGPFVDSDGYSPKHTFFYPAEDNHPGVLARLSPLVQRGHGEVEVHLHHDNDSAENMLSTLRAFKDDIVEKHGYLGRLPDDGHGFCFIHGNWALCNSHPEGRWCGVSNEIKVLLDA